MAEYIEREALLKEIDEEIEFESPMYTTEQNEYLTKGLKIARKDIKRFPSADVVEVVRCRDCKCYEIHKPSVTMNCERDGRLIPMMPDDYCSYGERRSE